MIKVKEGDVICGACRLRHYKCRTCSDRQATCEHYVVSDDKDYQPPTKKAKEPMKSAKQIPLPLSSVKGSNSHSQCCICKRRGYKFIVVPSIVIYNTLIENNIVISPGARCCPGHIYDDNFNEEAVNNITDLNTETLFNKTEIYNLIQNIRDIANKNKKERVNFDVESL
jgi:hypothetical protein